jgi:hypothetical protein
MVRLARAATGIGLPELPTRAQQAGFRLEDVPRPSLGRILRRNRLDAKIRRALGRALRRRRPKD